MPTSTVVMPTLRRTEMLALALERLQNAKPVGQIDVNIYLDEAPKAVLDDVEYVRDMYYPTAAIFQAGKHVEAPSGCWNILNALKAGYETGADYVYLVEEDVMVAKHYFQISQAFHEGGHPFALCGRMTLRHGKIYTNPGASFPKTSLAEIVPHINAQFFADRRGYMDRTFGPMDEASDLDDGLIRRVIRHGKHSIGLTAKPIVFHQGFHAYNLFSEYKNEGSIAERIARLRGIFDRIDVNNRYTKDFEPFTEDR